MSDQAVWREIELIKRALERLKTAEKPGATGTFTPTLFGSGTAGTFTYDTGNTEGQWTRNGDRILFNGRILITATTVAPTGNMSIGGLPFTSGANAANGNILGGAAVTPSLINLVAGYTQVHGVIVGAATSILLYETGDNVARAIVQGGEFGTTPDIFFWGSYKVD